MNEIIYFHRNPAAGFSINKVVQTVIRDIENKREFYAPYVGGSPVVLLKNILFVFKNRGRHSINHITGDILYCVVGLIGCKSVLTIHDTVVLDFQQNSFLKQFFLKWIWLKIPMMLATKVVCISEDTRKRLYKYTKRRDFVVIHNAVDPVFKRVPKSFLETTPLILIIGTNENKNLIRTFEALKGLNCSVRIIGKLNTIQRKSLEENHLIYSNDVGLTDEQLAKEYEKCDFVSFVSLFEGFGMILIEANMVGRPVICSDIDVLHEVGRDAALYVDPLNVDSMRDGFKLLLEDDSLRKRLVENGYENVKRFNADVIRTQWLDLYEEINRNI